MSVSSFRERYLTNIWNLPNILTILRMALIPVFVILHSMGPDFEKLALLTFCIASFTDWLDGHIARKYNLVTNFGKFIDPVADKLLVLSTMAMISSSEYSSNPALGSIRSTRRKNLRIFFTRLPKGGKHEKSL